MMLLNEAVEADAMAVRAGDSLDFAVESFDDDAQSVPANLTGWTFSAQWRSTADSTSAETFAVDETRKTVGVIVFSLTPAQTRAMGGDGVYDVQGVNGARTVTLVVGSTVWRQDVTR